jgi:hypothetical protein
MTPDYSRTLSEILANEQFFDASLTLRAVE